VRRRSCESRVTQRSGERTRETARAHTHSYDHPPPVPQFTMEARVESAISMGKGVFAALPSRADAVDALLAKHFAMSVPAFRAAARASCVPRKSNAELVRTQEAVHELLVGGAADMRALECWLLTRVPQVSDGNNFGAEVQHFVLEQLQKSRAQLSGLTELMTAYLKARGEASEKLGPAKSSESTTAESAESKTEEGVAKESSVKKTEKSEKSVTKEEVEDLQHHVVELDVKQYVALEGALRDLSQAYVRAFDLLDKNKDKCENPRGDADASGGGRMNSMY